MSKTRLSKPGFSAKSVLTIMLIAASSASYAAESIDQLATRIGMDHFREAIKKGERSAFKTLPAKGYKNGLTGLLIKTNTYVNPEYSFADCDTDTVIISVQEHKTLPGCRISLKLATKDADGSYHDNGIRVEYGIAIGSKKFIANNSAWAQHAISGDKVLEGALHPDKTNNNKDQMNNNKDQMCMGMAQFTANVTEGRNSGMTKREYYQRLDNMNGKADVTQQMITLYKTFVDYVYEHPKQDAKISGTYIYTNCMNNF
ncbi:hypothetical protein ACNCRD_000318 [Escherichia coli]|uniref:Uncharacterized protein n=7 Tax=Gammaproteobacteria TaxID=1236 RepID=A0A0H3JIV5_ECO57|nr:hypothetical protein [Escherichia coli]NP_313278.1 hypothetical protein ECs_5251 [Escherichia coli O157:H7 str. Sakai]EET3529762.1 hypothetical protein [Escherichia coli O157:NM]EFW7879491.1 hypothetical protein [Shigella sonnei]EFW8299213.1 hypothetical protein [Shigella flexneri]EHU53016.1 hypothetical protein ECDEC3B_5517 [Escherichia coli DEC3B]EHU68093.1 hypothetical protein ECDEC3D_5424 [Escherichia coli DEC3D]EHU79248.1 hypothetical protein ECDEC3C_0078 [Escherichia coli DEC3C]EHU